MKWAGAACTWTGSVSWHSPLSSRSPYSPIHQHATCTRDCCTHRYHTLMTFIQINHEIEEQSELNTLKSSFPHSSLKHIFPQSPKGQGGGWWWETAALCRWVNGHCSSDSVPKINLAASSAVFKLKASQFPLLRNRSSSVWHWLQCFRNNSKKAFMKRYSHETEYFYHDISEYWINNL